MAEEATIGREGLGYLDQHLAECIENVKKFPDKDYPILVESVRQVAVFADRFDWIATSGKSRPLTAVLLQAAGISPGKIIKLNDEVNRALYYADDEIKEKFPEIKQGRQRILEVELEKRGITGEGKSSVSLCFVDDRANYGQKAGDLLYLAEATNGLLDYAYAVIGYRQSREETRERVSQIGADENKLFLPEISGEDMSRLYPFLDSLSSLVSATSREYRGEEFSPGKIGEARPVVKETLKKIFSLIKKQE